MIDTPALPVEPIRETAALTPRGHVVVKLIRNGWLRRVPTRQGRLMALATLIVTTDGLTGADRVYLSELLDAHQS